MDSVTFSPPLWLAGGFDPFMFIFAKPQHFKQKMTVITPQPGDARRHKNTGQYVPIYTGPNRGNYSPAIDQKFIQVLQLGANLNDSQIKILNIGGIIDATQIKKILDIFHKILPASKYRQYILQWIFRNKLSQMQFISDHLRKQSQNYSRNSQVSMYKTLQFFTPYSSQLWITTRSSIGVICWYFLVEDMSLNKYPIFRSMTLLQKFGNILWTWMDQMVSIPMVSIPINTRQCTKDS